MRTTVFASRPLSVHDYRCTAGPGTKAFTEVHAQHSVSYVRRGSFGCRTLGEAYDLVAGAVMVGRPGREYMATHEHHGCGDECLSFKLSPELAESFDRKVWDLARVPPVPELMVLGELAQAAVDGHTGVGVDEAGLLFVSKSAEVVCGEKSSFSKPTASERRRAVEAALWIEDNAAEPIDLQAAARQAGLSPFHFLRVFTKVTGVTPHQYLLRTRLRRAARLLARDELPVTEVALESGFADLSNFVRTFRRAAGVSPGRFRKNLQDRSAALA